MLYGLGLDPGGSIDEIATRAKRLAATGVSSLWSLQIFGWDTLTVLAMIGRDIPDVELGTAVVPVQPRHPFVLAAQALTVQSAIGGRLALGIGLSHQIVVENVFGASWDKPGTYMDEYLSILMPLLRGEPVAFKGELLSSVSMGPLQVPTTETPSVVVAALGTRMLKMAGSKADGTVTWMVGPQTLADHIVPTISQAAADAGRPTPRVVVQLPVCVTEDPDAARKVAGKIFNIYGQLPSYRAMLDREGAGGPADIAICGTEEQVAAGIRQIEEAGATEFSAVVFGDEAQTERGYSLVSELAKA
jgi:F420-dependent oxidoreductase-like protein